MNAMTVTNTLQDRMNIRTIVWPIFLEHLVRMSLMTVDVLMLARYSEAAVAAVGLTGHMIFFMVLTYMMVSSGSAVLIGQNLGADKKHEAAAYSQAGFNLSLILAALVGALFYFGTHFFVSLFQLEAQVAFYSEQYLLIVGTLSVGLSISIMLSTILRAYGHSKAPMVIQLISGVINVIGNYLALFPPFGLPETGVVGVALATVFSQVFSAIACWVVIKRNNIELTLRNIATWDTERLKGILKLGVPNAGEGLSYNFAQIVIMYFVAQLGTAALAAAAIAQTLSRFMFVFAMSIGNGAQILSSYFVGQGRASELKRRVHKYWLAGLVVSFSVAAFMAIFKNPIAGYFSVDAETQLLIGILLIASLVLEPARAINLIVIQALKGAGDVIFTVKLGIICMWGLGVLGAYVFGIHWAFGLMGIWLGVALDEWIRGIIMIVRWQREKWIGMKRV